ncbi:MAG: ATPase, partial [Proteobacteria bacterium]|nr:ATPase [Pseudomonadota bacterium]
KARPGGHATASALAARAALELAPRPARLRVFGDDRTIAAMAAFFYVLHGAGWQYGQSLTVSDPLYRPATTACLSAIIVMQIVNVFLCRSAARSVFSVGLLGNPLIGWGVILEIALILPIAYTPVGNLLFGTAPIAGQVWLFIVPFAVSLFILEELRKWLARRSWSNATNSCAPLLNGLGDAGKTP